VKGEREWSVAICRRGRGDKRKREASKGSQELGFLKKPRRF